jgi:hypothetical protein
MNRFHFRWVLALVIPVVVLAFGCGDPIPVKEMASARHEISRAAQVKADKYAPEAFQEAGALLIKSHDAVKAGKLDDAKKNAEASYAKANEAYIASLPYLAKDALDIADKSIAEAEEVYAADLANADYANAVSKQKSAHEMFESKKYYEAYTLAVEADNDARNAKNLSLGKKDTLKDAIDEVNSTIAKAEKLNAANYAPEKLNIAKENVTIARNSYDGLKLKEGFSAIEVAKLNADEAYLASLKATAEANINKAQTMIADAESKPKAKNASEEINGAKEMVNTAKSQYESGQYPESIQSSDEAQRLATIAMNTMGTKGQVATTTNGNKGTVAVSGSEEPTEYDFYIVRYFKDRAKDCLWFISAKFYKNPREWKKIFNANRDIIKNPNLIRPGWKLKIPKKGTPAKKKDAEEKVVPAPKEEEVKAPAETESDEKEISAPETETPAEGEGTTEEGGVTDDSAAPQGDDASGEAVTEEEQPAVVEETPDATDTTDGGGGQ